MGSENGNLIIFAESWLFMLDFISIYTCARCVGTSQVIIDLSSSSLLMLTLFTEILKAFIYEMKGSNEMSSR